LRSVNPASNYHIMDYIERDAEEDEEVQEELDEEIGEERPRKTANGNRAPGEYEDSSEEEDDDDDEEAARVRSYCAHFCNGENRPS
jgi:hypothetical protein